jgi:RNase P subunit RPR2
MTEKPHISLTKTQRRLTCPFCGTQTELAVKASHRTIAPGSNAICGTCGAYCVLGSDLEMRKPTEEELAKVNLIALQRGYQLRKDLLDEDSKSKA